MNQPPLALPPWPFLLKRKGTNIQKDNTHPKTVAVIGGGPAGMTIALLLSRAGHKVLLYEAGGELGGLWSVKFDQEGYYLGENSCKVFQSEYNTTPALFKLIGTTWQNHFIPRYDLRTDWVQPFIADCSIADLFRLGFAFILNSLGLRSYKNISVAEYMDKYPISEGCKIWLRATALGGVSGSLKMTTWELAHRLRSNLFSVFGKRNGILYWNKQPPNSPDGFVTIWHKSLIREGVEIQTHSPITKLISYSDHSSKIELQMENGSCQKVDAVHLAVPPPALSKILEKSSKNIVDGFSHDYKSIKLLLKDSVYEHLGLVWFFDRPLPVDLPLGGHNVRKAWHPIIVQYPQYKTFLKPPSVTVVVGSVSLATDFLHPRLGTMVTSHDHAEIAKIIWEDERIVDPSLPEPIKIKTLGLSSATQIVHHGSLPIKSKETPVYLGTNLNGQAPYFTSSLEYAIQAGAAAAAAFEPGVEKLPVGR